MKPAALERPAMRHAIVGFLYLFVAFGSGCVSKKEHDRLMAESVAAFQRAQQQHQAEMTAKQQQVTDLQTEIARLQGEIAARDKRIEELTVQVAGMQRQLDDTTALNQQLGIELEKAGKGVDKLVAERGNLAKALEDTKARLEELRKAQEAAQKRAELLRDLLAKFKKMIDAGDLDVVLRDGRMVLKLKSDVLFDSGKTSITAEGKKALEEVARVLATFTDRELQVGGHTDNVPISSDRFPSNWELSTTRAVSVVKFLIEKGVRADLLSAAGFGEFDPIAPNDTPESRAKNRRIEIMLQPNIAELVQIPEMK
jgi:chemotaxis protein MotB